MIFKTLHEEKTVARLLRELDQDAWLDQLIEIQSFTGKIGVSCMHIDGKPAGIKQLLYLKAASGRWDIYYIVSFCFTAWVQETTLTDLLFIDIAWREMISVFFRMINVCSSNGIPAVRTVSTIGSFLGLESISAFFRYIHARRVFG